MLKIPDHHPQPLTAFAIPRDENRFVDWLVDARPGDILAYYRGHLAHDRLPSGLVHRDEDRRKLSNVADRVLAASDQGLVMPVQRRVGECDWLYLAIRTSGALVPARKPDPRSHAMRSLHHV